MTKLLAQGDPELEKRQRMLYELYEFLVSDVAKKLNTRQFIEGIHMGKLLVSFVEKVDRDRKAQGLPPIPWEDPAAIEKRGEPK